MKFDLYFLKNALKNWLPWCCSADKILHWLPLSSSNGLLFILSFRSPHLNVFSKEDRMWYDLERIWRDGKLVDMNAEEKQQPEEKKA